MRRLLSVGFLPIAIFVTCFWTLIRAGSFSGQSHWARAIPRTPATWVGAAFAVCASAVVLALLLRPFQIQAIRILEGYWDRWAVTARLADVLVEHQRRRWRLMSEAAADIGDGEPPAEDNSRKPLPKQKRDLNAATERMRANARERLAKLPPVESLLPTALGNTLRAAEIRAGERYGLATLASWPRIYPQVSAPLAAALESARDAMDTSVNLCYSFFVCTIAMGVALYDQPGVWWLPITSLAASALAYKGAVAAAQSYAQLMHVVYDLHRFDLVRALHYRMPSRQDEWGLFQRISDALTGRTVDLPYEHGRSKSDELDSPHSSRRYRTTPPR